MAKKISATPAQTADENHGHGGRYVLNHETGTRDLVERTLPDAPEEAKQDAPEVSGAPMTDKE